MVVGSSLGEPKLNFICAIFWLWLELEGLKENPNGHGSQGWLKNIIELGH